MKFDAQAYTVNRVVVLGAGTMGAQIAAQVAARGIPCDLLDMRSEGDRPNGLAEEAKVRLSKARPSVLESPADLDLIHPGNFDDDMARVAEADWVIEAIVERPEPKAQLWSRVGQHIGENTIASSNTSGIPIAQIAEALPEQVRSRFLGTHFFNPPRYVRLLELISAPTTDPAVLEAIRAFASERLDKGVVRANDVPGFISNRIGTYYFLSVLHAAEEFGFSVDEVDAITGPLMGRPGSATYRTLDLVGLDIFVDICDNTKAALEASSAAKAEADSFIAPALAREMISRGWLGNKSGQGFYKRAKAEGDSTIFSLQTSSMEYQPRQRAASATLKELLEVEETGERIRRLVSSGGPTEALAWRVLSQLMAYSAWKLGEVADDLISIDRAMRWGFNWALGPFETWDAIGIAYAVDRMAQGGMALPDWVARMASTGDGFYREQDGAVMQVDSKLHYTSVDQ
ncbi:MAG: 3-hydroxyacyl-CoA dehydrogenase NAD-binding domain-containing protein [Chloroflexi bacterium]|nr:3-hydroxyacyl-CoA dehydrogenase NAD-binding domain-containing protein [Chloroflexota bacterium]MDA1227215.1 3-hydroxyacyl-CoA dehydrogenase NAD-binding domain-containing protein [Chloroflexota bacterium]